MQNGLHFLLNLLSYLSLSLFTHNSSVVGRDRIGIAIQFFFRIAIQTLIAIQKKFGSQSRSGSRSEKKLDRDPSADRDPVRDRIDPNRKKIVFGWFQGIK